MVTNKKAELTPKQAANGFFGIIGFVAVVVILWNSYYTVSAGERGVLLTFGAASPNPVGEGLHFKIPFVQSVVKMNIQTQKYGADASGDTLESASSSDLQIIKEMVVVNYRLDSNKIVDIYTSMGTLSNVETNVIQPVVHESIKAITAKYSASDLVLRREDVKNNMETTITNNLKGRGVIVEGVSITKFDYSDEFNKAIENKVTAIQNAEAAKNKLEQTKYEADQRIAQATGEAEAIKIQAEAIQAQGGSDYVKLQAIAKWDGKLSLVSSGGSTPFIDVSSIISK